MKRLCPIIFVLFSIALPLFAEITDDSTVQKTWLQGQDENTPYHLKFTFDSTAKANLKRKSHGKVQYAEADLEGSMVFYHDECNSDSAYALAGYEYTRINWRRNPYFKQDEFNTLSLGIGASSKRMYDWLWLAEIRANFDVNHFKFSKYVTWDLYAWGRYTYSPGVNIHLGFLAFTGMKFDRVCPIVGFDWHINEKWKLNAVFPVDISLQYFLDDNWSISFAAKAILSRHRTGPNERLSRAVVVYTSGGLELGIDYLACDGRFSLNAHVGEMLGGRLKITNQHYHHKKQHRFRSCPYVGGELAYRF
ncbi:Uncharacterized protein PHSC3_000479 [Chlamydiales bacterium STE3]|nr:Uncharacterized protein PHSC3_000479 [Chlamydiales bacterium STE3]